MTIDPYLLVRSASIYLTLLGLWAAWTVRRPSSRAVAGAVLATAWNIPLVLALNVAAQRLGWWTFDARGGLLLGMPVDLYLAWVFLWGAIPALALHAAPLAAVTGAALAIDMVLMPVATPVIRLGDAWLAGEAVGLVACLVPAQLLARWTAQGEHLPARALLQVIAFGGLTLFVIPTIAITASSSTWVNPLELPVWFSSLMIQILAVPAAIGLSAVQEFVTRGGGTPVPFDPPQRLVTSGVYSYVRNPMQLAGVSVLVLLGVVLLNPYVSAAGLLAHTYSVGIAGWDENEDLRRRYGSAWTTYRAGVRSWIPRVRPWFASDAAPAQLFVSETCGMCSEVAAWFVSHHAKQLTIVAAESHPSRELTRITYEPADGSAPASGVIAVARALEHVHLGWALVGFTLRLPVVAQLTQLLLDASGAAPRPRRGQSIGTLSLECPRPVSEASADGESR